MKNEDLLLSKLLEETCLESSRPNSMTDANDGELVKYFEKRLNQVEYLSLEMYIKEESLNSFSLVYNINTKCFRLICGNHKIDFPSNWSIFNKIQNESFVYVTSSNDEDFLCEIFSEINKNCESFVIVNESGRSNLILFDNFKGKEHVDWMREYFDKKLIHDKLSNVA